MPKINKKIILLGLLAVALLVVPFHFSNAASIVDVVSNPTKSVISGFAWIISTILYLVGYTFSKLVFFGGLFFNWTLDLNASLINNPVVSIGWGLVRDIANLGFVLLIIFIAFSTILRIGSFQMKQALPKLIIAALLINFSLIIAAVVLDAAGIFMNFFLNNAYDSTSTQGGISQALATSLSLHKGLQPPPITGEIDLAAFGVGIMGYIANIVFLDIMTIVGAITMFALGLMFMRRYIYIGIQLIMLPMAILGWVAGSGIWSSWTKKFLNYTFFGPLASFFVYIALKSTLIFESNANTYFNSAVAGDSVLQNLAANLASMIMLVALLLLGLKYSEEMAGDISVGSYKIAQNAINGFMRGTASTGFSLVGGKRIADWASKVGKDSKSPIWRGLTRPLRQIGGETAAGLKKYGGITGIYTGVSEEISAGMGFETRKFRLKEEGDREKKEKEEKTKKEKREKKAEKLATSQTKNKKLFDLNKLLAQQESDLRASKIGFTADENKSKAIEKEIEKTKQEIEKAAREKNEADLDLKETESEDLEKLKKEVEGLKEKTSEDKGGEKKEEKK